MKKFFTLLLSIAILFTVTLSGCSCNPTTYLVFDNSFNGGSAPEVGYKETLTYSVCYKNDASAYPDLVKSSTTDGYLTADGIKYEGTYVTHFEVFSNTSAPLPQGFESDIFEEELISKIYYFKTELNVTATYTFENDTPQKVVNDKITTQAFFLPSDLSFAPLYTTYFADMHVSVLGTEDAFLRVNYDYKTSYTADDMIMDTVVTNLDKDGNVVGEPTVDQIDKGYTFRTDVDNSILMFALRSFKTYEDKNTSLSIIAPAYEGWNSVSISKHEPKEQSITFATANADEKLPVKTFSFVSSDERASGRSLYFTIQTGKSTAGSVENKSLLVSFAQPLFDYSSMSCLGAMEFNLTSIA